DIVKVWRNKLSSISWFMRCLNQAIARQANIEDQCTGKFWECRFTSQALKTEEALLSCMAYVDLNPVRAKITETPEASDYTSIQERIKPAFDLQKAVQQQTENGDMQEFKLELKPLLNFDPGVTNQKQTGILYEFTDYLELLDWTGRVIRDDKCSSIDADLPPILARLGISGKQWRT
ncbi:MAG: transposase, partial [Gammaproteobacteria bacterium]|nr:transposase [Gammaproteobacteria bacterium]